jgi:hypothetical protein
MVNKLTLSDSEVGPVQSMLDDVGSNRAHAPLQELAYIPWKHLNCNRTNKKGELVSQEFKYNYACTHSHTHTHTHKTSNCKLNISNLEAGARVE